MTTPKVEEEYWRHHDIFQSRVLSDCNRSAMLFSIEGAVRTYLQRGECKFEIADQKASSSLQNFFAFEMVMKCWLRLAT